MMTKSKKKNSIKPRTFCNGCVGLRFYFGDDTKPSLFTYCDYPSSVDIDEDAVTFHHRKLVDLKNPPEWCYVNKERLS
jgi:hypothetical protein